MEKYCSPRVTEGESIYNLSKGLLLLCSTIFQLYREGQSFLVEETRITRRKPLTCRKSLTNFITYGCIEYISPWAGFELTTSMVLGTDCAGSCKSNYHTIRATSASCNVSKERNKHSFFKTKYASFISNFANNMGLNHAPLYK